MFPANFPINTWTHQKFVVYQCVKWPLFNGEAVGNDLVGPNGNDRWNHCFLEMVMFPIQFGDRRSETSGDFLESNCQKPPDIQCQRRPRAKSKTQPEGGLAVKVPQYNKLKYI